MTTFSLHHQTLHFLIDDVFVEISKQFYSEYFKLQAHKQALEMMLIPSFNIYAGKLNRNSVTFVARLLKAFNFFVRLKIIIQTRFTKNEHIFLADYYS